LAIKGVVVALIAVAAPFAASAGERRIGGGVELLPLLPPSIEGARVGAPLTPSRHPVCVRLCDGFFFPLGAYSSRVAGAEALATCRALCPATGVALYYLPGQSDGIEDAVDASGASYATLPTAFRYRSGVAPTCSCRAAGEAGLAYWRDPTLRSGDAIMTAAGAVVFRGAAGGAPYGAEAFIPVEAAPLGAAQRNELDALTPAAMQSPSDLSAGIAEARRASGVAGGEIRFLETRSAGGG